MVVDGASKDGRSRRSRAADSISWPCAWPPAQYSQSPCGGTCLTNSHNNRIRWNVYSGNGSVEPANNDFGIGLVGSSSDNLIEENIIGGNTNGVLLQANARGNLIRRNTIVGNPPAQVSATFGAAVGADIMNLAPASANTFEDNVCFTYAGEPPDPC